MDAELSETSLKASWDKRIKICFFCPLSPPPILKQQLITWSSVVHQELGEEMGIAKLLQNYMFHPQSGSLATSEAIHTSA